MAEAIQRAQSSAVQHGRSKLTGTYHSSEAIDGRLKHAEANYHLVSPFTAVGAMPEGCGVQIALVRVDSTNETYDVGGGKSGLSKSALDRIAHAVGLSWDPGQSRRLDDGSDPHYVHFKAVGRYRASDGQHQIVIGEKEMDLRDGSPQLEALWERYRTTKAQWDSGRSKRKYPPKEPSAQIREMRLHVLSHAETKARLRAIRSMGIRSSYSREELSKPFACARVVFTGHTENEALRHRFAEMTAASFLGGVTTLYGEQPGAQRQLPAGHAPPPIGRVQADADDFLESDPAEAAEDMPPNVIDHQEEPPPEERPRATRSDGPVFRFGRCKGELLSEAEERDVEWYVGALRNSVNDPDKARFRADNERELEAAERELARRRGEDGESSTDADPDSFPGDDFGSFAD